MIDFRYHVVSLVAVFLALAGGIVVGGVLLDGTRVHDLRGQVARLQQQRDALAGEQAGAQARLDADRALVDALTPRLTDGALRGVRVAVLLAPGVSDAEGGAASRLVQQAGGQVSGVVTLAPALSAPTQADLVDGVSTRVVPAGTKLPAGSAGGRAAEVLAAAVTGHPVAGSGRSLDDGQSLAVLQAYAEAKLVGLPGSGSFSPAATVLYVLPAAAGDRPARELAAALARDVGGRAEATVVLGAPGGSDPAGSLTALRHDLGGTPPRVSTVDGLGTPQGQLAGALALAAARHGQTGSFGEASGAIPPVAPAGLVTAAAQAGG